MQDYDAAAKTVLLSKPHSFFEQIETEVDEWISPELSRVQSLRVDMLGKSSSGAYHHLELQSTNDLQMPLRMAEYALFAYRLLGVFPKQKVIYLGNESLRMSSELTGEDCFFRFRLIDIRELEAEDLLASSHLADNILAILAGQKNRRQTIREVLGRIAKLEGEARGVAFQQLVILSGLRKKLSDEIEEETQHVPILNDMLDHELLGPAIRKGLEQGRKEGMEKGRQEGRQEALTLVRHQIEKRFGKLPTTMQEKLAVLTPPELDDLALRVLDAKSLEDLFMPR